MVEQGTHKPLVGASNPPSATSSDRPALEPVVDALAAGADGLRIPAGCPIVLAVSGGPDSIALLHGAAQLAPSRGWRLTVAHLDHALRDRSNEEASAVAAAAE